MRVLEDQRAVRHGQEGVERIVRVCDLDLALARKRSSRPQREGELLVDGKIVWIGQTDWGVFSLADVLAQKGDCRSSRSDSGGEVERAAITKRDMRDQFVTRAEFG